MSITLKHFKTKVLPLLRAQYKTAASLKKGIQAFLKQGEGEEQIPVVNEDGEPVEIEEIILVGAEPAEEPADEPADAPADVLASIKPQIVKAVRDSIKAELADSKPPIGGEADAPKITLPANVKRFGKMRNFKTVEEAYAFGRWAMAALWGSEKSAEWCKTNGFAIAKAQTEGVNSAGGFLVPDQFENTLIDLREMYGVFRANARVAPMTADTLSIPRRTSGLTTYWVGENEEITESQKGWDRVNLTAKKLGVLTKYSSELAEDAIISIADDLAGEIAYAFALKEDQCGFLGDGSATYSGIMGVSPALKALSATIANIAGLVVSANDTMADFTLAEFNNVVGKLPTFGDTPNTRWYMHKTVYHTVCEKLKLAAGGNTSADIAAGGTPRFIGYDVVFTQVMPKTDAVSQIDALLGDLSLASTFGDRRQTTIATSEHIYFAEDELGIRGTERFDINVHDVGNASATAASREPGPIVGLISAAS